MGLGTTTALVFAGVLLAVPAAGQTLHGTEQLSEEKSEVVEAEEHDHEDETQHELKFYEAVEVSERADNLVGIAGSANQGTTGREELARRPRLRAGDLVETVPGAVATQHSGGGKANQYFLRGFNLDHGTDFAISVAGMPVNMPSHGHGQGYADLNFLIPELVQRAHYRKGPYFAEVGDFSSAGGVAFDLVRSLPKGVAELTLGSYAYQRALWADTFEVAAGALTGGVEFYHNDGPWERGDDYGRFNGFIGYSRGNPHSGWSINAMGSDGEWLATDQIPRRAVEDGTVDRYGLIDLGPRGSNSRFSLSGEVHAGSGTSLTSVSGFAIRNEFDLISNFTYFLDDPIDGDQFEQLDDRWVYGIDINHRWSGHLGRFHADNTVGLSLRYDDISNGLYRTTNLVRTFTTRQDEISQVGGGLWGESWIRLMHGLKLGVGLRADYYGADVSAYRSVNSGTADEWMLNPKLTVVWDPMPSIEFYLNAGSGFHSNDARGATIRVDPVTEEPVDPVDAMVRATGVDLGFRAFSRDAYHTTVSVFWLELASELLFVGDAGATEASRPSRRLGIEWTNYWRISSHMGVDLDLTWAGAEFTDQDPAGSDIPGAIEATVAGGLTVTDLGRWSGALRLRYFSGGPLIEDGSVSWGPTVLLNGRIAFQLRDSLTLALDVFNLLDREDDDIAYYYASRLPGEPVGGVEDIHFHPMEKPSMRLSLVWRY